MKSVSVALAGLVLIAVAGCKPESAEPVAPAEPLPRAAPAPAAVAIANAVPSDHTSTFDQRGFAGTFTGAVGDVATVLTLAADGSFVMSETRSDLSIEDTIDGTWTVEAEDRHVRLDPNSKAASDRLFAIASSDRITPLASDGAPLPGSGLARQ